MVNPDPKFQDKKRYVRVSLKGCGSFVAEPNEAQAFVVNDLIDEQDHEYTLEDVWMTPHEYESLPEFTGW